MRKLLIAILLLVPFLSYAGFFDWFRGNDAPILGAPDQRYERNLFPFETATYNFGSSTQRWLLGSFNNASTTNLTIDGITGSTQCLQVNSSGDVTGSGAACGGSGGSGTGNVGTSSVPTIGQLSFWTTSGDTPELLGTVATTSATIGTGLTYSGTFGALVGGAAGTLSADLGTSIDISGETNLAATWPVILTDDTLSFGGLSTSTEAVIGNLPYFSGVNTFDNVATSSVTFNSPITTSGTAGFIVGGSGFTLDVDDIGAADLASADFGEFTCNGTTCVLDYTAVTLNDFTNDADFITWTAASSTAFTWAGAHTFNNTATTTFSGGLEANIIGAPFFFATSTTATSTFLGGIDTNIIGCTQALETDATGGIICGTDATGAGGSGNTFFELLTDANFGAPTTTVGIVVGTTTASTSVTSLSVTATSSDTDNLFELFDDTSNGVLSILDTGEIRGLFGAESAPTYSFLANPDAGLYSAADDHLNISVGGSERLRVQNTILTLVGTGNKFVIEGTGTSTSAGNFDFAGDVEADQFMASGATSTFSDVSLSGNFVFGGDTFAELVGDGLDISAGDLIFDCSDVASTGLTCSGENLIIDTTVITTASTLDDLAQTSLADPGADQLVFWDDSDTQFEFISTLTGLAISGNTLTVNDVSCTDCLNATEIEDIYLLDDGDVGTGVYDFGGTTSFEITNGTGPTVDVAGEIALDTTSNNLVVATSSSPSFVAASATSTLYAFAIASTSADFVSGGIIELPSHYLEQVVTGLICDADAGTSVVVNLSDGTNDTDAITCSTTEAQYAINTNNVFTAMEDIRLEVGTITGTVDRVSLRFVGYRVSD